MNGESPLEGINHIKQIVEEILNNVYFRVSESFETLSKIILIEALNRALNPVCDEITLCIYQIAQAHGTNTNEIREIKIFLQNTFISNQEVHSRFSASFEEAIRNALIEYSKNEKDINPHKLIINSLYFTVIGGPNYYIELERKDNPKIGNTPIYDLVTETNKRIDKESIYVIKNSGRDVRKIPYDAVEKALTYRIRQIIEIARKKENQNAGEEKTNRAINGIINKRYKHYSRSDQKKQKYQ